MREEVLGILMLTLDQYKKQLSNNIAYTIDKDKMSWDYFALIDD
jgi:hypothetical protein